MPTRSDCGAGRFLVALLGEASQEQVKHKLEITQSSLTGFNRCQCGKRLSQSSKSGYCRKCLTQAVKIDVACSECGKLFKQNAKTLIWKLNHGQKYTFCSHHCRSKWSGTHYGWGAHPAHRRKGISRKWDWNLVWQEHLETGFGAARLSRILGIPVATISSILSETRRSINGN